MASNKNVIVLTPSCRRKTVRVTPNTTILQILEEVCQKEQLQPEEYDLKHHREVLDATTAWQFSGLPNNALLEMVPVGRVRKESSVTLGLQLESGDRLMGTFLPSDSLWTVVTRLCPEEEGEISAGASPVVIYMRQEIAGVEALKGATLRHLGLTGGRAMLRFVHRTSDKPHTQANVSAPLKRVQVAAKEMTRDEPAKQLDSSGLEEPAPRDAMEEEAPCDVTNEGSMSLEGHVPTGVAQSTELDVEAPNGLEPEDCSGSEKMDVDTVDEERCERLENVTGQDMVTGNNVCVSDDPVPDSGDSKPILLGERNAVVFLLDSAPELLREELPDSFFELTVQDVRVIYSDLRNKRAELEEAPLSTSAMRELEKSKQILNNLGSYRKVVLRIQFPDRTVLQGMFSTVETIHKVIEFVQQYLENPNISFHLFTTPPKQILEPELTLVEAGCVPSALLHFGCDGSESGSFIRADVLSRSSSFAAAMVAARGCRGKTLDGRSPMGAVPSEKRPSSPLPSTSSQSDDSPITQDYQSRASHNRNAAKAPKWFKIGK